MGNFERQELSKTRTTADRIRSLRLAKGVGLDFVAKKLNIPEKYLNHLETGQHDSLPGDIYVRAWLKKIAEYYQISSNELLVDYRLEKNIKHKIAKVENRHSRRRLVDSNFLRPKTLRWLLVIVIVLALLVYLVFELVAIIAPPYLNISQPPNNYKTSESVVEIVGQTKAEAQVLINGELIPLDKDGRFKKVVNLTTGLNNLQISAKKKHSQVKELELLILRETIEN